MIPLDQTKQKLDFRACTTPRRPWTHSFDRSRDTIPACFVSRPWSLESPDHITLRMFLRFANFSNRSTALYDHLYLSECPKIFLTPILTVYLVTWKTLT
ncbi:hypothetical protein CPB83DRAFT_623919 [Crepidotus variabilis]|uniref:Uncharacterized protein n=1 Tax=Crepidotus variabilis TaxID=179855 RepID=A0A9P6JU47_9AGAR|nr:hypothetical protein CPB83DRAFT_623919 [Crepidotus variabilis]